VRAERRRRSYSAGSGVRLVAQPMWRNEFLCKVAFSSHKILQNFSDFPSHQIFEHMHEALNIDKK
jgi:hypothetical protein